MTFTDITQLATITGANQDFSYKDWRFSDSQLYNFVQSLLANRWKHISSAPIDGTRILIKHFGKVYIGYFNQYSSFDGSYTYKNWITGWNKEFNCPDLVLIPEAWAEIPE